MRILVALIAMLCFNTANGQPWSLDHLQDRYLQQLRDRGLNVIELAPEELIEEEVIVQEPEIIPEPELPPIGNLSCRTTALDYYTLTFECEHTTDSGENEYGYFSFESVSESGQPTRIFTSEWSKAVGVKLRPHDYVMSVVFIDRYNRRIFKIIPVPNLIGDNA